jgi:hypothetical protein
MGATIHEHDLGLTWVERGGTVRSAHALRDGDRMWLIDPWEMPDAITRAVALGTPAGVIQLLDRHNRDCAAIAARLAVPHLKVPDAVPDSPFEVLEVVENRLWHERALWWAAENTLIVAEAVGTVPVFAVGRPLGMHPGLRLRPPERALTRHRPDRVLVGHGPPVLDGAAAAIDGALAGARRDVPKLLISLPKLVRQR